MLYQLLGQGHPYVFAEADKYLPAYKAHSAPRPKLSGTPRAPAKAEVIAETMFRCLYAEMGKRPTAAALHKALTGEAVTLPPVPSPPPPAPPASPPPETPARLANRITLTGPGGAELSIGARVVMGRVVLAKFGDAAKYAANEQFVIDRVGDEWFVEACENTPNDTMLNGALLAGRKKLAVWDVIAVGKASRGKTVLELTVRAG
jgi:hypothetical protein